MLICTKTNGILTTRNFLTLSMIEESTIRKGLLRRKTTLYSIVGVAETAERVVLYKGKTYKEAKRLIGKINFACANNLWGGGIYYV